MNQYDIPEGHITKEYIRQFLPANPVVIEAGAHIGRDTEKMARLWPDATIYAFEPVPELFKQLQERTMKYSNVHCFNLALSNREGEAVLNVSAGASTAASSLLKSYEYSRARPDVHFHELAVKTVILDHWAHQTDVKKVDFIWLDLQGYELEVLKASPHLLSTARALLIEASLNERFKNNPLYDEIKKWIESQGFKALIQDAPKHHKVNIFFVKECN